MRLLISSVAHFVRIMSARPFRCPRNSKAGGDHQLSHYKAPLIWGLFHTITSLVAPVFRRKCWKISLSAPLIASLQSIFHAWIQYCPRQTLQKAKPSALCSGGLSLAPYSSPGSSTGGRNSGPQLISPCRWKVAQCAQRIAPN